MKKTEEEVDKVATEELNKRYGKGAENKSMNKIWVAGFKVGFVMGQQDVISTLSEDEEKTEEMDQMAKSGKETNPRSSS